MVFGILVDLPGVAELAAGEDVPGHEHRGHHRVVLVVVFVHAVAADEVEAREAAGDRRADRLHLGVVAVVVDRIRLRLADDMPVDDIATAHEAELLELARGQGNELVIARGPQPVPLETEVFEAVAGEVRIGDELRRPAPEVLHAPHLHAGVVDVDPVVFERLGGADDEGDGEEIPVLEPRCRVEDIPRRRGGERSDQLPERRRGNDMIGIDRGATPVGPGDMHPQALGGAIGESLHRRCPAPHQDRSPGSVDPPCRLLPHHPRAEPRIAEGVDERRDLRRTIARPLFRSALRQQRVPDRPGERQSANPLRRPVGGDVPALHPPDLLGVGLEEDLEQPPAEAVADPVFERPSGVDGKEPGVEVAGDAAGRLDRAEIGEGLTGAEGIIVEVAAVEDP